MYTCYRTTTCDAPTPPRRGGHRRRFLRFHPSSSCLGPSFGNSRVRPSASVSLSLASNPARRAWFGNSPSPSSCTASTIMSVPCASRSNAALAWSSNASNSEAARGAQCGPSKLVHVLPNCACCVSMASSSRGSTSSTCAPRWVAMGGSVSIFAKPTAARNQSTRHARFMSTCCTLLDLPHPSSFFFTRGSQPSTRALPEDHARSLLTREDRAGEGIACRRAQVDAPMRVLGPAK
mmetsp:Transcript_3988/g.25116  ORF Transcript_3988/g.25116 Transcript_3988/m.25116 type:complete len:235 (-) Transcript_3988:18-722(-)